jgi:hypothetical protein
LLLSYLFSFTALVILSASSIISVFIPKPAIQKGYHPSRTVVSFKKGTSFGDPLLADLIVRTYLLLALPTL